MFRPIREASVSGTRMSISNWVTKRTVGRNLDMQVSLAVVCFVLGVLLVTQFRTQNRITQTIAPASSADQVAIMTSLVDSNAQLRTQVDSLESDLAQYQSDAADGKSNVDSLASDLELMRILNGLVEVTGPGVRVTVSGQMRAVEIQDLLNELRNSGAEGISLNGNRVVARTSVVTDDNGQISVDTVQISSPYVLEVIGDPETLRTALERKGGMVSLLKYNYGEQAVKVESVEQITLPLYKGVYDFVHAQEAK